MVAMPKDAFCSFCGAPQVVVDRYPRTCARCGVTIWANPLPVVLVLVPVDVGDRVGLLVVRRAIEPRRGLLGLVGGFLEAHETWAEGGAREVREESGLELDPATLTPLWFASTAPRPDRVLLFALAPTVPVSALPPFRPNPESSERGLVFGPDGLDAAFAFPLHVEAVRRWRPAGAHDYLPR
jgi:ADP-ribose pyrophosphatase YjhB (NUDIX family)